MANGTAATFSAFEVARGLLVDGRRLSEIEPGIYSALPDNAARHRSDHFGSFYDRLNGSGLCNRLLYGAELSDYRAFAEAAVRSASSGPYLDAGGGSMLFAAGVYARAQRPIIAIDNSLTRLRRARARLQSFGAGLPANVVLIQAELLDLPFRPAVFSTVLSMGMLHIFADAAPMLNAVRCMLMPRGRLYLSTLVLNDRYGDRYLRFLHRHDRLAAIRSVEDVRILVTAATDHVAECRAVGNIAYAIAGVRA